MSRLQTSGAISLADIRNQFGGSYQMSQYYRGGVNATYVHSYGSGHNTSVPTSGAIDFADFYGAHRGWDLTVGQFFIGTNFIRNYGYSNGQVVGAFGSIAPGNYRGAVIVGMYRVWTTFKGSNNYSQVIYLRGNRARNWFNRYTDGTVTLYTSNASHNYNSSINATSWIWNAGVNNTSPYSNGARLSPETPQ